MKYFFTNLKRFDIPVSLGGINRLAPVSQWGYKIVRDTEPFVNTIYPQAECVFFLPEAHLLPALAERGADSGGDPETAEFVDDVRGAVRVRVGAAD